MYVSDQTQAPTQPNVESHNLWNVHSVLKNPELHSMRCGDEFGLDFNWNGVLNPVLWFCGGIGAAGMLSVSFFHFEQESLQNRVCRPLLFRTKMGRNSACPRQVSNFCGLDKSTIPPVYVQLSTTLYRPSWASMSCCSQHFFPVYVLASCIHLLPVVTLSDNDSKQIAVATSFRMSALLTLRTFLVKVKKI